MEINIKIEKKHFIIFSIFILLLMTMFTFSKDIEESDPWHYLQQIAVGPRTDSNKTSVDQNDDGMVDWANNASYAKDADTIDGYNSSVFLNIEAGGCKPNTQFVCTGNYYDCNGDGTGCDSDGCEALLGSEENCKACGDICGEHSSCISEQCQCEDQWNDVNGDGSGNDADGCEVENYCGDTRVYNHDTEQCECAQYWHDRNGDGLGNDADMCETRETVCTLIRTNCMYADGTNREYLGATSSRDVCEQWCEKAGAPYCGLSGGASAARCYKDNTGSRLCCGTACGCGSGNCYKGAWDCQPIPE